VKSLDTALAAAPLAAQGVTIRHVRTHEEFVACVQLQRATWGANFNELIPVSMLMITQRLGGVTAGAFTSDGALQGFVFGITGVEHGHIVHWSDMLAVRNDVQGHGVGRRLKEFQRDAVRARGATRMYWTFDPLVARNAHFNVNRLGARVFEYVPDMYGHNTGSRLHGGFGTDRFIVTWPITPDGDAATSAGEPSARNTPSIATIPLLNAMFDRSLGTSSGEPDGDVPNFAASLPPLLRVEIPSDILEVSAATPSLAKRWRSTTRSAFQWALANGYSVERFERGAAGVGSYVLSRAAEQPGAE